MIQNPRELFLQVLEIIGYSDDREEFTNKFFQLCEQQTIVNLLKSLPQDKQDTLQAESAKQTDPDPNNLLLKKYFTQEQVATNLQEATRETFNSYLQTVIPTLNNKQKTDLETYLKSLSEKYPPPAQRVGKPDLSGS